MEEPHTSHFDIPFEPVSSDQPLLVDVGADDAGHPVLVPATPPNLVVFDADDAAVDLIADLLVRSIALRGTDRHRVWIADTASAGQLPASLSGLHLLAGISDQVAIGRQEIDAVLGVMRHTIVQRALDVGLSPSFLDAGGAVGRSSVLLVADLRYRQLAPKQLAALLDVCRFGPRFGVGALVATTPELLETYQKYAQARSAGDKGGFHHLGDDGPWVGDHVVRARDGGWELRPHGVRFHTASDAGSRARAITAITARDGSGSVTLAALLAAPTPVPPVDVGVTLRLGADAEGLRTVTLGDSDPHLLLIGRSGAGKSTLLHQVLAAACLDYGPDDLRLWVLDLKGGNEFADLAPELGGRAPAHLDRLVLDSEPELAQASLRAAVEELDRRADLFRSRRFRDLAAARAAGVELARILIVVDEFQVLFEVDETSAVNALDVLARKGRSYGIHLVLASQKLGPYQYGARAAFEQATIRVALGLSGDARDAVLGHRAQETIRRRRSDTWVGGPPPGYADPEPRGSGWAVSSTHAAAGFVFARPDHELLAGLRAANPAGDPVTLVAGVYQPVVERPTGAALDVGVRVIDLRPVLVSFDRTETSHLMVVGQDPPALAALHAAARYVGSGVVVHTPAGSAIPDAITAAPDGALLVVDLEGAPAPGHRSDLAGDLAAAVQRDVHVLFVASSERSARRVLGIGWHKLARHVLVLHAAGFTQWPLRTKFRPAPSRAALVDNGTGEVATVLLRGSHVDPAAGTG